MRDKTSAMEALCSSKVRSRMYSSRVCSSSIVLDCADDDGADFVFMVPPVAHQSFCQRSCSLGSYTTFNGSSVAGPRVLSAGIPKVGPVSGATHGLPNLSRPNCRLRPG